MRLKPENRPEYLKHVGEDHQEYWFMCPGCRFDHRIIVKWGSRSGRTEPAWSFNGNLNRPTFQPSLLVRHPRPGEKDHVCHSFIREGEIQFLPDSTHSLAGETVPLADVE